MATKTTKKPDPIIRMDETGPDILASAIVEVADAAKKLLNTRLTDEALYTLLAYETKLPKKTIKTVLEAAADLKKFTRR